MTKERFNKIVFKIDNIVLFLMVFYSAFRSTIFPQVIGVNDRVLVVLTPVLLVCFMMHFIIVGRNEKKNFLKENAIIIIYLFVRGIALIIDGINTYTLGSIMYETVFLLFICRWTVGDYSNSKKCFGIFIVLNLIVNIMSFIVVAFPEFITLLGVDLTIYHENVWYMSMDPYAALYLNPNTAGIMTAMALIIFLAMGNKSDIRTASMAKKLTYIAYIVFTVFMIYKYGCRSAIVGLILVVGAYIVVRVLKVDKRKVVQVVFVAIIVSNIGMVGYISINNSDTINTEGMINAISSGRYKIWNDAYHTANYSEAWLLGHGSNETELENRNAYLEKQWVESGQNSDTYVSTTLGIHNGYLGVLFNTGIIAFVLFVIIMLRKIRHMKYLEGYWYLAIIFVLVVNNFESMIIMNKFYTCFLMMIILCMNTAKESQLPGGSK